ncbi:WD40-repeat-containing domain protein [Lyophyllum atratum]|nr:WD40-repeat-containing domain protein [Lyophyllum atratum]
MEAVDSKIPTFPQHRSLYTSDERVITALRFDQDAQYLATCDRAGLLIIYFVPTLEVARNFKAKTGIGCVAWHPKVSRKLAIGCENGDVNVIRVSERTESMNNDALDTFYEFDCPIRHLEYGETGRHMAVAFDFDVCLFEEDTGDAERLPITPKASGSRSIIRGTHFVKDEKLIVCFMDPESGILVYSTSSPPTVLFRLEPRAQSLTIGASAISPSGTMLAVSNYRDGVDFYSLQKRRWYATTKFDVKESYVASLQFIGSDSVAVGHSRGDVVFATTLMKENPIRVDLMLPNSRVSLLDGATEKAVIAAASTSTGGGPIATNRGPRTSMITIMEQPQESTKEKTTEKVSRRCCSWKWRVWNIVLLFMVCSSIRFALMNKDAFPEGLDALLPRRTVIMTITHTQTEDHTTTSTVRETRTSKSVIFVPETHTVEAIRTRNVTYTVTIRPSATTIASRPDTCASRVYQIGDAKDAALPKVNTLDLAPDEVMMYVSPTTITETVTETQREMTLLAIEEVAVTETSTVQGG